MRLIKPSEPRKKTKRKNDTDLLEGGNWCANILTFQRVDNILVPYFGDSRLKGVSYDKSEGAGGKDREKN